MALIDQCTYQLVLMADRRTADSQLPGRLDDRAANTALSISQNTLRSTQRIMLPSHIGPPYRFTRSLLRRWGRPLLWRLQRRSARGSKALLQQANHPLCTAVAIVARVTDINITLMSGERESPVASQAHAASRHRKIMMGRLQHRSGGCGKVRRRDHGCRREARGY